LLFDAVFFVVLVSAISQGWPLPWLANRLGLQDDFRPEPTVTLEITALKDVDADIVEYTVEEGTRSVGQRLSRLALPDGVVVALIARGSTLIPPRGSTRIAADDHLFVVLRPETRPLVDHIFSREHRLDTLPSLVEFPLLGRTTAADLREFYDIRLDVPDEKTLDELLRDELGDAVAIDRSVTRSGVTLRVLKTDGDRIAWVGLTIPAPQVVESAGTENLQAVS
jgi:cell volume regulation protein A